ncbi:hypothetical protein DESUT3_03710 [Desulfuromonas versatilis]|uniref:Uncharacterized protein n=1 Tax=Desulfuromonas versatilis TaxID=2802975 RepID=A0ABN6DT03_9BACT|nr:hypothetical protein [Desulfuromonas versatilis]BCR03302.1 hypothetical protein DESUT3_03710 [Desulfuromonas versatilis]
MMIRVEYPDGQQRLVRPNELDKLIASNGIKRFERSDGWAILGESPMRARGMGAFQSGRERRAHS